LGNTYRMTFTVASGDASAIYSLAETATTTYADLATIGTGNATHTVEWTPTAANNLATIGLKTSVSGDTFDITNLSIDRLGCVAEYLPSGINATQWVDTSGNNLHGTTSTATAVNHEVGAITATGVVEVNNGIKFPATAVASADANTLDDYEEGLFGGNAADDILDASTSGTITCGSKGTGSYTKIGRMVFCSGHVLVSGVSSPTGNLKIKLPFICGDLDEYSGRSVGSFSSNNIAFTAGGSLATEIEEGWDHCLVSITTNNAARGWVQADAIVAADYLTFSISYTV